MKNFFIKKSLNKKLNSPIAVSNITITKSIGLLVDETFFSKKEELIKELIANGVDKSNIEILVFRDKYNKNEVFHYPTFSNKHLSWSGKFTEPVVNDFIKERFDLLISYYDVEKAPLMVVTNESNASFKVGFASIDDRLNNLIINTQINNYKIFTHELFRYLKILKRI